MEVTGRIKLIGHTQDISSSFRKREVVITTEEQYPQHIMIEFTQDKISLLDAYQVGEQVKVAINLRGREWQSPQGETRYFNTIQGWRIEHMMPAQQGGNMGQQENTQSQYGNAGMPQQGGFNQNQQQGFAQNTQGQQQGGFNQNQQQDFAQNTQAQQQGGFNQNQQQGFAQNTQSQQQGGFNPNQQQGFNQGQNNMGQQFPPASSYQEEDHDDLPF